MLSIHIGYPLVNKHSYWKWTFTVDLPIKSMVDLSSSFFVGLPGRVNPMKSACWWNHHRPKRQVYREQMRMAVQQASPIKALRCGKAMEIQSLIVKAYDIMISDWSWFRKRGIERYWNHIKLSFFQINQKKRDWNHKTIIDSDQSEKEGLKP